PISEALAPEVKALQQIAFVKRPGLRQTVGSAMLCKSVKASDVGVEGGALKSNPVAFRIDPGGIDRQGFPQHRESLAQAGPRLLIRTVLPEQRRKFVARVSLSRRQRHIGQQGLAGLG